MALAFLFAPLDVYTLLGYTPFTILCVPRTPRRRFEVPIYEYRCSQCGEKFEKLVRTTSGPLEIHCPACASEKVDRQISNFSYSGVNLIDSYTAPSAGGGCGHSGDG